MGVDVIYGIVLGLLSGLAFQRIAVAEVQRRTDDVSKAEAINNTAVIVLWMLISAVLYAIVFYQQDDAVVRLQYVLFISIGINIAVIDIDIRKVPNELVLGLLLVRTSGIIGEIISEKGVLETIFPAVLGLAIGFMIFLIPSFMNIPIGAGDTKYCAAIGYCLGLYGFLEAAIVMAIALGIYLAYLSITKRGSLKTQTAMGPYLSLGVVVTLMYPWQQVVERFL